jgi:hypothetical protein
MGTHCNVTAYRNTVSWQCGRDSWPRNVSKVGYAVMLRACSVRCRYLAFASNGRYDYGLSRSGRATWHVTTVRSSRHLYIHDTSCSVSLPPLHHFLLNLLFLSSLSSPAEFIISEVMGVFQNISIGFVSHFVRSCVTLCSKWLSMRSCSKRRKWKQTSRHCGVSGVWCRTVTWLMDKWHKADNRLFFQMADRGLKVLVDS